MEEVVEVDLWTTGVDKWKLMINDRDNVVMVVDT